MSCIKLNKKTILVTGSSGFIGSNLCRVLLEHYKDIKFKYVIADEAQYIKNNNTKNAKALKELKSEVRFALTGTPIENGVLELWSIFDFIMPGFLSSMVKFQEKYKINEFNDEAFDAIAKNIGAIKNGEADYNRTAKYIINEIKLEHIKGITFDYEK